jgi:hypothetical protein
MNTLEKVRKFFKEYYNTEFNIQNIEGSLMLLLCESTLAEKHFGNDEKDSIIKDLQVLNIMNRLNSSEEDAIKIQKELYDTENQIMKLLDLEFSITRSYYIEFWKYFVIYHNRYMKGFIDFKNYVDNYYLTAKQYNTFLDISENDLQLLVVQYRKDNLAFIERKKMLNKLIIRYSCYFYMIMYNVNSDIASFLVKNIEFTEDDGFSEIDEKVGKFFEFNRLSTRKGE